MAQEACEYRISVQCCILFALTFLHNFYCKYDPDWHYKQLHIHLQDEPPSAEHGDAEPAEEAIVGGTKGAAASLQCDRIATEMWAQYQAELEARQEVNGY